MDHDVWQLMIETARVLLIMIVIAAVVAGICIGGFLT